jgi:arylsulfatase A-like enzyme
MNLYDAEILYTDGQLGRFLDELASTGLYDRSLIVVVGDHGEAFHEHGLWQHTLTLYEEMIRIPLIVKWPQTSPTGETAVPVSQVDIFSTILEAAGVPPPPNQGTSLLELSDEETSPGGERHLVSEAGWKSGDRMVRKIAVRARDHKYIVVMEDEAGKGWPPSKVSREELYDLERDPTEQQDLAQGSSANLGFFRQLLRAYLDEAKTRHQKSQPGREIVLDEETRERMRSLGYLDQ